jgi:CheY-like chemotaxis protein
MQPKSGLLRVVVVEDNASDVLLVNECLSGLNTPYELTHFIDGVDAVSGLCNPAPDTPKPDLIVLDINMPKMNGLEVLARIKECELLDAVPIVILTSSFSPEERENAHRLGVHRFVRKPSDLYGFLEKVTAMLRDSIPLAG